MRKVLLIASVLGLAAGGALACDDHIGECKIEAWRGYPAVGGFMIIDGVATCDSGELSLRLYDGEGENAKFFATETAFIEAHAFKALVMNVGKPKALSIRYSIKTGG